MSDSVDKLLDPLDQSFLLKDLLPEDATHFDEIVLETVEQYEAMSMELFEYDPISFYYYLESILQRVYPVIDYLAEPRSIEDYNNLRAELEELILNYYTHTLSIDNRHSLPLEERITEPAKIRWVINWIVDINESLRFFPELDLADKTDPLYIEKMLLVNELLANNFNDKKISLQDAILKAEILSTKGLQVGVLFGKFRIGSTPEHRALITAAKEALGPHGVLFVFVESKKSIMRRVKNKDTIVLKDIYRLNDLAEYTNADFVVLANPVGYQLRHIEKYFFDIKLSMKPNLIFIGAKNYDLRGLYQQEADQLGSFLLWRGEQENMTTTKLLNIIKDLI